MEIEPSIRISVRGLEPPTDCPGLPIPCLGVQVADGMLRGLPSTSWRMHYRLLCLGLLLLASGLLEQTSPVQGDQLPVTNGNMRGRRPGGQPRPGLRGAKYRFPNLQPFPVRRSASYKGLPRARGPFQKASWHIFRSSSSSRSMATPPPGEFANSMGQASPTRRPPPDRPVTGEGKRISQVVPPTLGPPLAGGQQAIGGSVLSGASQALVGGQEVNKTEPATLNNNDTTAPATPNVTSQALPPVTMNDTVDFTILMMVRPLDYMPEHCGRCWVGDVVGRVDARQLRGDAHVRGFGDHATFCAKEGDPAHPPPRDADVSALWYFLPRMDESAEPLHLRPDVPVVGFSPESAVHYPWMNNPTFMRQFDIEQSYRVSSKLVPVQIPWLYGRGTWEKIKAGQTLAGGWRPPLPVHEKINAIAVMISNCNTPNKREELIKRLMAVFRVDSFGTCLNNMGPIEPYHYGNGVKKSIFAKYRFCVAFENAIENDYVTEKVFQGLYSGCLPLYWGASNVQELLPYNASRMIVDRGNFASEELFFQEIKRLAADDEAYGEYMTWQEDLRAGVPFHPAFKTFSDTKSWTMKSDMCQLVSVLVARGNGTTGGSPMP
eukprot:jgi/Mesvir1/21389/Mv20870-RA.1